LLLAYAINTVFAFTYNVGDTHVFYLPGHLFTVFLAGAALSPLLPGPVVPSAAAGRDKSERHPR